MKKVRWLLFLFILCAALLLQLENAQAVEKTYTVIGSSMIPALLPGERIVVEDSFFENNKPRRGNMVVIRFKSRKNPLVKRITAIAGDRITFQEDTLQVNGETVRQINTQKWLSTIRQIDHYRGVIPTRTVLVLGDNYENSRDSRRLGLIAIDQLDGKVVQVIKGKE